MKDWRRFFICGLATLLCAQMLYGALVFSSLYKHFQAPALHLNSIVCRDIAVHLSLITRAGKKLPLKTAASVIDRYYGRVEADDILVTDPAFRVLVQMSSGRTAALPLPEDHAPGQALPEKYSVGKSICTSHAVEDRHGKIQGHVFVITDRSRISSRLAGAMNDLLMRFLAVSLAECATFAVLLALFRMLGRRRRPSFLQRMAAMHENACLRACFLIPLCLGQMLFLFAVSPHLAHIYDDGLSRTGYQIAQQTQWELSRLVRMGMPLDAISGLDRWMMQRQDGMPALGMAISDQEGRIISAAGKTGPLSAEKWRGLASGTRVIFRDILGDAGSIAGGVSVVMDWKSAGESLRSVLLDTLAMTVVAAIFLCELLFLILRPASGAEGAPAPPSLMRPAIFFCMFAHELSWPYVPIRAGQLGLELWGLPPDIVAGLPVSCEMLTAGAAMLLGGAWSQRHGWRAMLLCGACLCGLGAGASSLSSSALPFLFSRGACGLGYGFINLAAQVFVIAHSDQDNRAGNLAFMFAGLYAGSLCGSTLGGLLADRLGYQASFTASCAALLAAAALLHIFLPRGDWHAAPAICKGPSGGALRFLGDRRMAALFLFVVVPNALITVCLCQFFVPLALDRGGVSPASIGRVFLFYSLIVMFAGPALGRAVDKSATMVRPLACSMILAAVSVAALLFLDGMPGTLLCMAALAMSTSIASNGQGAYALSLPAAERFGRERTMGAYNVAMRAGQVLGPLSLGVMASLWSAQAGLAALSALALACGLLFPAFTFAAERRGRTRRCAPQAPEGPQR